MRQADIPTDSRVAEIFTAMLRNELLPQAQAALSEARKSVTSAVESVERGLRLTLDERVIIADDIHDEEVAFDHRNVSARSAEDHETANRILTVCRSVREQLMQTTDVIEGGDYVSLGTSLQEGQSLATEWRNIEPEVKALATMLDDYQQRLRHVRFKIVDLTDAAQRAHDAVEQAEAVIVEDDDMFGLAAKKKNVEQAKQSRDQADEKLEKREGRLQRLKDTELNDVSFELAGTDSEVTIADLIRAMEAKIEAFEIRDFRPELPGIVFSRQLESAWQQQEDEVRRAEEAAQLERKNALPNAIIAADAAMKKLYGIAYDRANEIDEEEGARGRPPRSMSEFDELMMRVFNEEVQPISKELINEETSQVIPKILKTCDGTFGEDAAKLEEQLRLIIAREEKNGEAHIRLAEQMEELYQAGGRSKGKIEALKVEERKIYVRRFLFAFHRASVRQALVIKSKEHPFQAMRWLGEKAIAGLRKRFSGNKEES